MKCKTDKEAQQVGVEWSISQTKELLANGVPGIHFFTMGRSSATRSIVKEVF
jgi:methylenetetrahydrofolate reductase (NADPH)